MQPPPRLAGAIRLPGTLKPPQFGTPLFSLFCLARKKLKPIPRLPRCAKKIRTSTPTLSLRRMSNAWMRWTFYAASAILAMSQLEAKCSVTCQSPPIFFVKRAKAQPPPSPYPRPHPNAFSIAKMKYSLPSSIAGRYPPSWRVKTHYFFPMRGKTQTSPPPRLCLCAQKLRKTVPPSPLPPLPRCISSVWMRWSKPPPIPGRFPPSWVVETTAIRRFALNLPWQHSYAYGDGVRLLLLPLRRFRRRVGVGMMVGGKGEAVRGKGAGGGAWERGRWIGCSLRCRGFCR